MGQPGRPVPPEFPFTPVRDLIGILRVVYAKELERKVPRKGRLAAIKKIADELQRSIRIAATHDPGTAPYTKALSMADAAVLRIGGVFTDSMGLQDEVEPLVEVAVRRVRGVWSRYRETERQASWAAKRMRS